MTIVKKITQHGDTTLYAGTRRQVIDQLRIEAKTKRLESRKRHNLPTTVSAIDSSLHQSKLVTMASYEIEYYRLTELIDLLDAHGSEMFVEKE